ncbi:MAG: Mo-dependent nitrogenase C-terminal domain-containing protein [Stigonema ocellatum SAG 48.90 = DSM 106950]|nr:Mo-dependent nitrogenase C-terminal domain-containing protein [Stigonema ocellatum SAG 48.90 = DSM 106950]
MESVTHTHDHHSYHPSNYRKPGSFDILSPLRRFVDGILVKNSRFAHFICKTIPCCCPFERDLKLFGRSFHVPPMCKLNPLYDNLVGLRFRALSYLADDCGEDVTKYIC